MNRVKGDKFPSTICRVVHQSNQFSVAVVIKEKKTYVSILKLSSSIRKAYYWYLKKYPQFKNIFFFDYYNDNLQYAFTVGKHDFYRLR